MDIPKNNVFNVSYTSILGQANVKKQKTLKNKLKKIIKANKLIIGTLLIFIMCFVLNIVLIYNFMSILKNI